MRRTTSVPADLIRALNVVIEKGNGDDLVHAHMHRHGPRSLLRVPGRVFPAFGAALLAGSGPQPQPDHMHAAVSHHAAARHVH